MSVLEKRIAALELGSCNVMPEYRMMIFSGKTTSDTIGYTCGDVTVHRQEGESEKELRGRLDDLLDWSDPVKVYIVMSIDRED
jgi:hypothetical protein